MASPTVSEIWRFPVKSMRGERIEEGEIGESGLAGDRGWGIVDAATGKVLSAKREARLLEASAALPDPDAPPVVTLPDGREFGADDPTVNETLSKWLEREVRLERADAGQPMAFEMNADNVDPDSPVIEIPCPPGTFLDAAAVHVLTNASLDAARALYPSGQWDRRRFRPTLLIEAAGDGFVEDDWIGSTIRVGGLEAFVFAPTVRCVMTTRPQEGLERDLAIATTVNREHGSNLGVYAAVRSPGAVAVGDPLEISSS